MIETGTDPVASAMAGALFGVEEALAQATEVYGNLYAEAYWTAFGDLKAQVGSDVADALSEEFQVLFYAFASRQVQQRVGIEEVDDLAEDSDAEDSDAEASDSGRWAAPVCS